MPSPLWLQPASKPIVKKVDDFLSKQLLKRLTHGFLKFKETGGGVGAGGVFLGVGLYFHSEPLGGCSNGVCADEVHPPMQPGS